MPRINSPAVIDLANELEHAVDTANSIIESSRESLKNGISTEYAEYDSTVSIGRGFKSVLDTIHLLNSARNRLRPYYEFSNHALSFIFDFFKIKSMVDVLFDKKEKKLLDDVKEQALEVVNWSSIFLDDFRSVGNANLAPTHGIVFCIDNYYKEIDTFADKVKIATVMIEDLREKLARSKAFKEVLKAYEISNLRRDDINSAASFAEALFGEEINILRLRFALDDLVSAGINAHHALHYINSFSGDRLTRRDGEPSNLARATKAYVKLVDRITKLNRLIDESLGPKSRINTEIMKTKKVFTKKDFPNTECFVIETDDNESAPEMLEEIGRQALVELKRVEEAINDRFDRVGLCLVDKEKHASDELVGFCEATQGSEVKGRQVIGMASGNKLYLRLPTTKGTVDSTCEVEVDGDAFRIECKGKYIEPYINSIKMSAENCNIDGKIITCSGVEEKTITNIARAITSTASRISEKYYLKHS
ncbi:MAG: hypothetical protein ACP5IE_00325 [Infirmifilum sp.]